MKPSAKVDVAVLMLFFNRPDTLRQVFEQVRQARPSRLFLFQDGPRSERDTAQIEACRAIVEEIDWECEVHRNYQAHNLGCMAAGYTSHRWAFSLADKCIVLEDDVVPSQSFFRFCKEMLDRYETDERITMISGFNVDEVSPDVPYDYFFTSAFSIWGWASWRRVVEQWDADYSFLDDTYNLGQLERLIKQRGYRSQFVKMCRDHRAGGAPQFESVFWSTMLYNSGLAIMPTRNMINNVGASEDSSHYSAFRTMPRRLKQLFTMPRYEVDFPLRHPRYVIEEVGYWQRMYAANGWDRPWIKIGRSLEELWLNIRYGNWAFIGHSICRRLRILTGRERFS
ncbi:MAG: hemolysin activation protein [Prevotella sp.]|nr:hemolysin activation protein [Prevotella sp.]